MDVRHEPFQQEIVNQLISIINQYIKNNTDDLLLNNEVKKQVKEICDNIYLFSKMEVDVEGILSKHNLLSIDVVLFPPIVDVENQIAMDKGFDKLISTILPILHKDEFAQHSSFAKLFQQMNQIIDQVKERQPEAAPRLRW